MVARIDSMTRLWTHSILDRLNHKGSTAPSFPHALEDSLGVRILRGTSSRTTDTLRIIPHANTDLRKHGARPFQCHCGRQFSGLDDVQQHVQTVHVNEEMPAESLAATGPGLQKQVRIYKGEVRRRGRKSKKQTLMGSEQ